MTGSRVQYAEAPSPRNALLLLIMTLVTLGLALKLRDQAQHTREKPTVISARELALNGPPKDNWFVTITDYTVQNVTITKRNGSINYVNMLLVPEPPLNEPAREIKLGEDVHSEEEAEEIANLKTMTGLAHPGVFSFGFDTHVVDVWKGDRFPDQSTLFSGICAAFFVATMVSFLRYSSLKAKLGPQITAPVENVPAAGGGRPLGAVLLAGSLIAAKFIVWDPLEAAKNHQAPTLHETLVVILPFTLFYGLFLLSGNERLVNAANRPTPAMWIVAAIAFGIGFALKHWMTGEFAKYGYSLTGF